MISIVVLIFGRGLGASRKPQLVGEMINPLEDRIASGSCLVPTYTKRQRSSVPD